MNKKTRKAQNRGFALVETLVAVAIFGFIILITTGIFLGIVSAQRKAAAIRAVQDSVRFAIEAMSRDFRVGFNFTGNDCASHSWGNICREIRFTSTMGGGGNVCYRFQDRAIMKGIVTSEGCSSLMPLTPHNLIIERFNFLLSPTTPPRITIVLGATAGQNLSETRINIQSTLSQRLIR